jgi:hypothetical protein
VAGALGLPPLYSPKCLVDEFSEVSSARQEALREKTLLELCEIHRRFIAIP